MTEPLRTAEAVSVEAVRRLALCTKDQGAETDLGAKVYPGRKKISDDMTINSINEIDSLTFEMIIMEIEKRIQREADPMLLLELRSVRDLAAILENSQ